MNNMIQQRVAAVLLKHPETKDDDRMLTAYYWTMQMSDEGIRLETFDDFKREYIRKVDRCSDHHKNQKKASNGTSTIQR